MFGLYKFNAMKTKEEIFEDIRLGHKVTFAEAVEMLECMPKEDILSLAYLLREHSEGKDFDSCSIMNARSGECSEDCKWCSQSKFNTCKVDVYPLVSESEAVKAAKYNADKGVSRFSLVTSGRGMSEVQMKKTCELYVSISSQVKIKTCASLGLLSFEQMKMLKDVGVTRYHCNLETAPSYFSELCTTHTTEDKIKTIKYAQELGMDVCSGGIIGMGESMLQRLELAFELQKLGVNSIPINILNPIKGTPLQNAASLSDEDILLTVAFFRIINPSSQLRLAGGRGSIAHLMPTLLRCGVSGMIMGDMLTTVGSKIDSDMNFVKEQGFDLK